MMRIGLTLAICAVCLSAYARTGYVDGVVATVGREPILHSDVMAEIMPAVQALSASATSREEIEKKIETLFREALEQAIEHTILYREAKALDIEIPEDEVERRIAQIREQYASAEEFQRSLAAAGHTMSEFRDRMRRQIMAISMGMGKRRQFEKEAVVSEQDLRAYYETNLDNFSFPARFRVRRIFIQAEPDPESRAAARIRLENIRDEIIGGGDFAELARQHSQGPDAREGGLIGWVRPGDLVGPLDVALETLESGQVSDIIETEYGMQLLKLEDRQQSGVLTLDEARTEIEPLLRNQRADERYRQWLGTLRKRNNVRVLF